MSVMSDMLPSDAAEQAAIQRIFREQPDLAAMIETAQDRAHQVFADPRFSLDTHGYDHWDPPLRRVLRADVPEKSFDATFLGYIHWLRAEPGIDLDRLSVYLLLHAVIGSPQ